VFPDSTPLVVTVSPADFPIVRQRMRSAEVLSGPDKGRAGEARECADAHGHTGAIHASELEASSNASKAQPWEGGEVCREPVGPEPLGQSV